MRPENNQRKSSSGFVELFRNFDGGYAVLIFYYFSNSSQVTIYFLVTTGQTQGLSSSHDDKSWDNLCGAWKELRNKVVFKLSRSV